MKRSPKKLGIESQNSSLTIADTLGSCPEPATSISTVTTNITDPMPSVPSSTGTASGQVILASSVTTTRELRVSAPVSALTTDDLTPMVYQGNCNELPSQPDAIIQANSGSTKAEQKTSNSGLGFFTNAQNLVINDGNFIICENYTTNTGEGKMKIPVPQKPYSSLFFTGRKDVLNKLGEIFVHRTNSRLMLRRSCLLWGMGGIGKTQICLKFIEEISSFSHVFWVDASSHESITMSLKGISSIPAAQASHLDGSAESVLQWISCIQEEWLIVFDNADDLPTEVVAKFIPPGNGGNILVTSRNRSMRRVISFENIIEINELEESDAITLLLKASCLDASAEHLQAAKEIVNELGCIPLAVDQAGACIEAGKCDIDKYLRQLSSHQQTLMPNAIFREASNYDQTVYGTWDLSFKEIKRRAGGQSTARYALAAQAAISILQICAFYHHSNISKDIFQSAAEESRIHVIDSEIAEKLPQAITLLDHTLLSLDNDGHWNDILFEQGISVLLSFSLMKRGKSSELLSVHPLIHSWSREQMSKSEQQRMYQMGSIILSCAIPWKFTSQDYALRRLIFPHIKANELYGNQIEVIKQYYDDKWTNFALVMMENGDWNNAEQLKVQVMDMRKKQLGAEHPSTLTSMADLAIIYQKKGRWNEAEKLGLQAMEMRKELLGAEHPDTLTSMANLAITFRDQGRWDEAEQLEVQVMGMRKKLLGAEHPDTLTSMSNLANTYRNQGRLNEAEQLEVQVMDMRKKLLGAEHPDTLTGMANLARIFHKQKRWNEAEQLGVKVMNVRKKLLGAEHPDTLTSMASLAATYIFQGQWHKAEQLGIQVLNIRKKLLGAEHPDTLTSMGNLAAMYHSQGQWDKAEQLGIQVVDMRKKQLGAEHPDTLTSMTNLSITYQRKGKWNEAEQLGIQVMDLKKKLLGAEHLDTLFSKENLAITYRSQGRWNEAEHLGIQVMKMRKKLLGVEHPDTLTSMENLVITYHRQERWNEAEQLGAQVLGMRKKVLGAEHPDTLQSTRNLAIACQHQQSLQHQLGAHIMNMMNIMGLD